MAIWHDPQISLPALTALGRGNMAEHLGIEFTAIGPDWLAARMPVTERTTQPWGRLHGGASVALAETVGSIAAMLTLDPDEGAAVGLEINANHVRPASSGFVHAVARSENIGRTTQIWSIRTTDDTERLVSIARITLAIIPAKAAKPHPNTESRTGRRRVAQPKQSLEQFLGALIEGFA